MNAIFNWLSRRLTTRYAELVNSWCVAKSLPPEVLNRVRELVQTYEPGSQSGEWKRHQIYALLLKEFPTIRKSYLSLVIEVVKCGL